MGVEEVKTGYKYDGKVVMAYRRTILVYKRGYTPTDAGAGDQQRLIPTFGQKPK
jgi:hypothetical protein